jgi:hypothetical protein
MPQKRFAYLTLLLVLLSAAPRAALGDPTPSSVSITVHTTPEPFLNQLTSGDRCSFLVEIQNLGVSVQRGQVVNASDPTVKYSGNFTVETTFELRKQGGLFYGGQSVSYITSLNNTQIDNYYTITIPPIGEALRYTFTYNLTKGYEILGVRPDENMVLYFRVNVFVQTYSDEGGTYQLRVGDRITTKRSDYYVIDFVKQEYLKGKLLDIRGDVEQLKNINSDQVKIGKDYYARVLSDLNSSITRGDYVTALEQMQNYYQFDQPTLILLLFGNLNSTAETAGEYLNLKNEYTTLNATYGVIKHDFDILLNINNLQGERITQLAEQLQNTKDGFMTLAVTGIMVMFAVGFLVGRRPRISFK